MKKTLIYNARLLTPFRTLHDGYILFDEQILEVRNGLPPSGEDMARIDARGDYATPGFIDLHTHGGGGFDFADGTAEALLGAARAHLLHGTTTLLPTASTLSDEALFRFFQAFEKAAGTKHDGANLYGVHLEGPYFNSSMKGAQDEKEIKLPLSEHIEKICSACPRLVRWSAAPELAGGMAFGREMRKRGILAAVGHTAATLEQAVEAYENGYTLFTHFYNAMSSLHKEGIFRAASAVEAGYLLPGYDVEVIADGRHLPPALLRLVYERKGSDRTALITDSLSVAACPALPAGSRVVVEDGVAKLADRSALAGSVATSDRLLSVALEAGIPLHAAIEMLTASPARMAGMTQKGVLSPGRDADILLLSPDFEVRKVFLGGRAVA